jgi:hypothetical protein
MTNSIAAAMHQSKYTKSPHPVFLVDGDTLSLWLWQQLSRFGLDHENTLTHAFIQDLVPAQAWLIDDDEMQTAWRRIKPGDVGLTTIVPLLICPDDVDFSCSIIVAEQSVMDDSIKWNRFGFAMDQPYDQVGATVRWFQAPCKTEFPKLEFIAALAYFQKLYDEEWT